MLVEDCHTTTSSEKQKFKRVNANHMFHFRSMADLLSKFRIKYSYLKMIGDMSKPTRPETREVFDSLIQEYKEKHPATLDIDMEAIQGKTNRHLRLRELLLEHSSDATLVFM